MLPGCSRRHCATAYGTCGTGRVTRPVPGYPGVVGHQGRSGPRRSRACCGPELRTGNAGADRMGEDQGVIMPPTGRRPLGGPTARDSSLTLTASCDRTGRSVRLEGFEAMFDRFEDFDISTDGASIHGVRGGNGPPLLLLHGI